MVKVMLWHSLPRKVKAETGMDDTTFKKMYPTGISSPKLYGSSESTKRTFSLGQ